MHYADPFQTICAGLQAIPIVCAELLLTSSTSTNFEKKLI